MASQTKKTILVIDDDVFYIELLDHVLGQQGYSVLTAHDGGAAIKILSEREVDLIIVDLMMPHMDGLVFLNWLRQESALNIPVIVQTGVIKSEINQQVNALGATALIHKPIKIEKLLAKIKEIEQNL